MSARKNTKFCQAFRNKTEKWINSSIELIEEEPLLIRVDDKPYSVVMRTPGEELYHAAGFCLGEGIVDSPDDFNNIGYDEHLDQNTIDVWLNPERHKKIHDRIDRRIFISQTSCGICGKEMVKDIYQKVTPIENDFQIYNDQIFDCLLKLAKSQNYYQTTRCSHAALILDDKLQEISFAEDVGRHNALDKAIGQAFMNRNLPKARIAVLSSRNSYELVQKAARARLPMIISNSRPTALAVEMGQSLNMTLVFPSGETELITVCGESRIKIRRKSRQNAKTIKK